MKLFTLKADVEFYADDLDDAFAKLAWHFKGLIEGLNQESIFTGGEIEIKGHETKPQTNEASGQEPEAR